MEELRAPADCSPARSAWNTIGVLMYWPLDASLNNCGPLCLMEKPNLPVAEVLLGRRPLTFGSADWLLLKSQLSNSIQPGGATFVLPPFTPAFVMSRKKNL